MAHETPWKEAWRPLLVLIAIGAGIFWLMNRNDQAPSTSNTPAEEVSGNVFIDSVPRGAEVFLLGDGGKRGDRRLGKTPLTVPASECTGQRFWVRMEMAHLLTKLEQSVPQMADWVKRFRSDEFFGQSYGATRFCFDSFVARSVTDHGKRLVATGPVYHLDYPKKNRLCALFIPREAELSWFFPLMPDAGSFLSVREDDFQMICRDIYRMSSTQASEALGSIARCGAARVSFAATAPVGESSGAAPNNPPAKGLHRAVFFTVEGAPHSALDIHGYDATSDFLPISYTRLEGPDAAGLITFEENAGGDRRALPPPKKKEPDTKLPSPNIYIDSVPDGAEVYLYKDENGTEKKRLGKTPLVLSVTDCPGLRFNIRFKMADFLQRLETAGGPELKAWAKQYRDEALVMPRSFESVFEFEEAQSILIQNALGQLEEVGPIASLKYPDENRLCAVFMPRGMNLTQLFPLMPPPGRFRLDAETWKAVCMANHRMSEEQASEVAEALVRCGRAWAIVADPTDPGSQRVFSLTAQGPGNERVSTKITTYRTQHKR